MMLTWGHATFNVAAPLWRLAGVRSEPVSVSKRRYGYAPWRFRHRGDLYRVCRVEVVRDRGGQVPRRYFRLLCADGERYTLFQDLRVGTWHLERLRG